MSRSRISRVKLARLATWLASMWAGGCASYPWLMFRDNMLRPTPYMKVAEKPKPTTWPSDRITVTWIGHATVLINFYGTTILTDPVMGQRLAPPRILGMNLGIRRITELPVEFEQLPPIDVVLLSHAHYDHWDTSTLKRFKPPTAAIVPSHCTDLVPDGAFAHVRELSWGESWTIKDVTISAVQVEHWGQRGLDSTPRGFNGYMIAGRGKRIFFGGDSAYRDWYTDADVDWPKRIGPGGVDLCILPIGGYTYHGNHMTPEEAWDIFHQVGGKWFMPIHWRTFIVCPLDLEPIWQPWDRLKAVAADDISRVVCDEPGKTFVVPE